MLSEVTFENPALFMRCAIDFVVTKCYKDLGIRRNSEAVESVITHADIAKRIRDIRKKRGMSQARLGKLLGFSSHVPVAKMESGMTKVSVVGLEKIANALDVPLSCLIPSLRADEFNDFTVALRAGSSLTVEEQQRILRIYEGKRKQNLETRESDLGGIQLDKREGARALARYHLRELEVATPPIDLRYALFHWHIEYDEADLGERVSGLFIRDRHMKLICINRSDAPTRKRMTVAHELGHFHLDTAQFHCTVGLEDMTQETLAFSYAYELLMPSEWLKANKDRWHADPEGIARECQVSPIACEIWGRRLGLSSILESGAKKRHDDVVQRWKTRGIGNKQYD
jgi:transcriptional regulator with XRE-family HTH domain